MDLYDLYLFNDSTNYVDYVENILIKTIDVNSTISKRLVKEAQIKGRALIYTSSKDDTVNKRNELLAHKLDVKIAKSV